MTRNRLFAGLGATLAALATAGWLYAQETERPREPRRPEGGEAREGGPRRGEFRPPMMAPAQLAATENYVFVLRGNTLYKYAVKTMQLEGKTELERPEPPMGGPGREGPPGREGEPGREGARRPPPER
jgi:hypothetical protein